MAPTDADAFDRESVPCTTQCDALSVLKTAPGFFASKQIIARDGADPEIRAFNAGKWFRVYEWGVSNILQLSSALTMLETMPNCFVIRGALQHGLDREQRQQRLKVNFQTVPQGLTWLCIDVDKLPLPSGLRLHDGVIPVCEYLVGLLPPEFHPASYHWQLSSSAGVLDTPVVSMHLWYHLDRPIPNAELKRLGTTWNGENADRVGGKPIIDTRLFNDVQAHYTAAPMFVGMSDPFPIRSGLVRKSVDEVPITLPASASKQESRDAADARVRKAKGFERSSRRSAIMLAGVAFTSRSFDPSRVMLGPMGVPVPTSKRSSRSFVNTSWARTARSATTPMLRKWRAGSTSFRRSSRRLRNSEEQVRNGSRAMFRAFVPTSSVRRFLQSRRLQF